jgi:hypothetical protein
MSRPNCHSEVFRRILLQSPGEIAAYRGGSNKTLQGDCSDFAVLLVRKAGLFHAPSGAARNGRDGCSVKSLF